ncbi:hypothetical protein FRAAL2571 [Frankia alni ACN14a]|uniref:Uncharacterized protein n=1 Tax=Frankia alni (strain DSM 45986 / CECT 9034 / ACN14a) TaxID=326424 RepID=Q0RMM9_FRAAA|nr:hypothetical protein FRAAL2571 [Frankia alni ACN14a]
MCRRADELEALAASKGYVPADTPTVRCPRALAACRPQGPLTRMVRSSPGSLAADALAARAERGEGSANP